MSVFLTCTGIYIPVHKRQQSANRDLPQQQQNEIGSSSSSSSRTKSPTTLLTFPCMNHRRNAPPYSNPVGTETTAIRTLKRREREVGKWERISM
jgi:hypothetical protein